MNKTKFDNPKKTLVIFTFFFVTILDQLLKLLTVFSGKEFKLNSGISLGIGDGKFLIGLGLNLLGLILLCGLVVSLFRQFGATAFNLIVLTALVAASFSNLIDRFLYGGVIDFIDIGLIPTFNLADSLIVVSIILVIYTYGLRQGKKTI